MKRLFLLIIIALVGLATVPDNVVAQPKTNTVIDLNWVNSSGADSTYKILQPSTTYYSAWYLLSDSSAQGGGINVALYGTAEDTIMAKTEAQWAVYDYVDSEYTEFKTLTVLDSLTYGWHTGATTKNPISEPLSFRAPKGATAVRLKVTTGATVKQWTATGSGRQLDKLDGKLIIPKF